MNYTVWIDGDGKRISLENMSRSYIKNCMKEIERLLPTIRGYTPSKNDDDTHVFSFAWLYYHGHQYLQSLQHELDIQQRIAKEDYPIIRLKPSCDTCDNLICEKGHPCDKWIPRDLAVIQAASSEDDIEILQRTKQYRLVEIS